MSDYIELDRKFASYESDLIGENDDMSYYLSSSRASVAWEDVLKYRCAIIIAEAGSGKTTELKHMVEKLRQQGEKAFFFDISTLAKGDFNLALGVGKQQELKVWQKGNKQGYFFLDAVDEAKLVNLKDFEHALKVFVSKLDSQLHRVHSIISSRPAAWQANADRIFVQQLFELPFRQTTKSADSNDEVQKIEEVQCEGKETSTVQVLQLVSLTREQIKKFAFAKGVENVDAFIQGLEQIGAEAFVVRPQDLLDQIEFWKEHQCFGSYSDVIERNIKSNLAELKPHYDHSFPLSPETARCGAEFLAAAVTLEKKTSILLPDESVDKVLVKIALEPKYTLRDWDGRKINALLGRAIFDEAFYGTVSFHHRTIREYLAARWLLHLLNIGKNRRKVLKLLFAEKYGLQLITPSMQPIVAWLAIWDQDICQRVIRIAPQILLGLGDPAALPIEIRVKLLRIFASRYKDREYTGVELKLREIKGLAHQNLKKHILELLHEYRQHHDIRQLLLRIIWQGSIHGCGKIALQFAVSSKMDLYTRICAIRAISTCGTQDERCELISSMLDNLAAWDRSLLGSAIEVFFPREITIDNLLVIFEQAEIPFLLSFDELSFQLKNLPDQLNLNECLILLRGLVNLLAQPPYEDDSYARISLRYQWLLKFSFNLAERILSNGCEKFDAALLDTLTFIRAAKNLKNYFYGEEEKKLENFIIHNKTLRCELFWHEIEKIRKISKERVIEARYLVNDYLSIDDAEHMINVLRTASVQHNKLVALCELVRLIQLGQDKKNLQQVTKIIAGNHQLESVLERYLKQYADAKRQVAKCKRSEKKQLAIEKDRESSHLKWVALLKSGLTKVGNLTDASKGVVWSNDVWLYNEISKLEQEHGHLAVTQWELLKPKYGELVANAFRDFCIQYWRHYKPNLHSQEVDMSSIPWGINIGLSGLAMEAFTNPTWAKNLSLREVEHALNYALREFNGFPSWFDEFLSIHFDKVKNTLINEIKWELSLSENKKTHSYILDRLRWGTQVLDEALQIDMIQLLEEVGDFIDLNSLANSLTIILRSQKPLPESFVLLVQNKYKTAIS